MMEISPEKTRDDLYPWMIRTAKNQLTGPLPRQRICEKIQKGELQLQDEICPANGHWIFLHESEEVNRYLGIVPRPLDQEDSTDTGTDTDTATVKMVAPPAGALSTLPEPELKPTGGGKTGSPVPHLRSPLPVDVEPPSVLKMILFVLILGIVISLILVVRLTKP
jgi:hypothetical protein